MTHTPMTRWEGTVSGHDVTCDSCDQTIHLGERFHVMESHGRRFYRCSTCTERAWEAWYRRIRRDQA